MNHIKRMAVSIVFAVAFILTMQVLPSQIKTVESLKQTTVVTPKLSKTPQALFLKKIWKNPCLFIGLATKSV